MESQKCTNTPLHVGHILLSQEDAWRWQTPPRCRHLAI